MTLPVMTQSLYLVMTHTFLD